MLFHNHYQAPDARKVVVACCKSEFMRLCVISKLMTAGDVTSCYLLGDAWLCGLGVGVFVDLFLARLWARGLVNFLRVLCVCVCVTATCINGTVDSSLNAAGVAAAAAAADAAADAAAAAAAAVDLLRLSPSAVFNTLSLGNVGFLSSAAACGEQTSRNSYPLVPLTIPIIVKERSHAYQHLCSGCSDGMLPSSLERHPI